MFKLSESQAVSFSQIPTGAFFTFGSGLWKRVITASKLPIRVTEPINFNAVLIDHSYETSGSIVEVNFFPPESKVRMVRIVNLEVAEVQ
jgi:hypothetical protein